MKKVRGAFERFATLMGLSILVLWAAGAILTDRFLVTQYIHWLPTWAVLVLAGASLLSARLVAPRRTARRSLLWAAASLAWPAALLSLLLVDLRIANIARSTPEGPRLRILHWNVTKIEDLEQINREIARARPNIAVLVDVSGRVDWKPVIGAFAERTAIAWEPGMLILSDLPIRRWGFSWLGLADVPADNPLTWQPRATRNDPGRAMFLELEAPLLERNEILWVLDMPSDWRKSRRKMALHARRAIDAFSGDITLRNEQGHTWREPAAAQGFPAPDIVVGDFNIPRGSASLSILMPGLTHAFDQAGWGYAATFPNRRPLLHIDHTFLAPPLRASRYVVRNPGPSTHRLQVVDIAGVRESAGGAKPAAGDAERAPRGPGTGAGREQ